MSLEKERQERDKVQERANVSAKRCSAFKI